MVESFLLIFLIAFLAAYFLLMNKLMAKLKMPESVGVILIIIGIPIFFTIFGNVIYRFSDLFNSFGFNNPELDKTFEVIVTVILTLLVIAVPIVFIIIGLITLNKLIGIKGKTPVGIYKSVIENDISKVADKILLLQNRDVKDICGQINKEYKENKKTKLSVMAGPFALVALGKDPWASFHVPKDMEIKEENNEIIIYYKKKKYNVNKGKYI